MFSLCSYLLMSSLGSIWFWSNRSRMYWKQNNRWDHFIQYEMHWEDPSSFYQKRLRSSQQRNLFKSTNWKSRGLPSHCVRTLLMAYRWFLNGTQRFNHRLSQVVRQYHQGFTNKSILSRRKSSGRSHRRDSRLSQLLQSVLYHHWFWRHG